MSDDATDTAKRATVVKRTVLFCGSVNLAGVGYENRYEVTDETDEELAELAEEMALEEYQPNGWFKEIGDGNSDS